MRRVILNSLNKVDNLRKRTVDRMVSTLFSFRGNESKIIASATALAFIVSSSSLSATNATVGAFSKSTSGLTSSFVAPEVKHFDAAMHEKEVFYQQSKKFDAAIKASKKDYFVNLAETKKFLQTAKEMRGIGDRVMVMHYDFLSDLSKDGTKQDIEKFNGLYNSASKSLEEINSALSVLESHAEQGDLTYQHLVAFLDVYEVHGAKIIQPIASEQMHATNNQDLDFELFAKTIAFLAKELADKHTAVAKIVDGAREKLQRELERRKKGDDDSDESLEIFSASSQTPAKNKKDDPLVIRIDENGNRIPAPSNTLDVAALSIEMSQNKRENFSESFDFKQTIKDMNLRADKDVYSVLESAIASKMTPGA